MSSSPGSLRAAGHPEGDNPSLEEQLRQAAAVFPYPLTPNIAARQRLADRALAAPKRRLNRLSFALLILFILVAASLLVTPVRARVVDWIRIGAVRIFLTSPTPTSPPVTTVTPAASTLSTPQVTPTFLRSVLDLLGETSLAKAKEGAGFGILLPAEPPDLGQPDRVYLQQLGGTAVILVWMDPDRPERVRMSLSEASSETLMFEKHSARLVLETQVNGQPAVWLDGDYILVTRGGDATLTRLVNQSHTLIWSSEGTTFRLETDLDLEGAIRTAKSLR
jgi:hypothetical protein